jgi:ubiquitin-conjugating enzyme E2 J2
MATTLPRNIKRLQKELADMRKAGELRVSPLGDDLQEWLFIIQGSPGTPYDGGEYMGRIKFGNEWPIKPPVIMLITPSGRFKPNTALCINGISHYHNENYSATMRIDAILMSLISYMADDGKHDGSGVGIMDCTADERKKYAADSHSWNLANELYAKHFC